MSEELSKCVVDPIRNT